MSTTEGSKWSEYFDKVRPEEYTYLGYYQYKSKQSEFTHSFKKESGKFKSDLANIIKYGSGSMKSNAELLNDNFKGHRKSFSTVDLFWHSIEKTSDEASSSTKETTSFKSSIASVKNVKKTVLNFANNMVRDKRKANTGEGSVSANAGEDDVSANAGDEDISANTGEDISASTENADNEEEEDILIESDEENKENTIDLKLILQNHCSDKTTSEYDPAHSFILDLSPLSAIKSKFSTEQWVKLTTEKHHAVKIYHTEIDSIITQLFGQDQNVKLTIDQARERWYNLRKLSVPKYSDEFSYEENDWKKILRWAERVTGQFLDAFESSRNPIQQDDCDEREWTGDYIVPLFQGVLKMDGNCRVPWGEINVLATQRRRNEDKDVLIEQVERGHQVDILCKYENCEIVCSLVCGGPNKHDLTKKASDEFYLPRAMKDMLDDIQLKSDLSVKDSSQLFTIGIQIYMTDVKIYLIEKREVYHFHLIKYFNLPTTISAYGKLKVALKWAWNVRGMIITLIKDINTESDGYEPPVGTSNKMKTKITPSKKAKVKKVKM